jgi:hypothetical protein
VILRHDDVAGVVGPLITHIGPRQLLVAAPVDLRGELDGAGVEALAGAVDADLRRVVPDVAQVFLDPSGAAGPLRSRLADRNGRGLRRLGPPVCG